MSDKVYIGQDFSTFSDNGKALPITRITLSVDEQNVVTVGDDTGRELIADCPYATPAMANALLQRLKGYRYQMYDVQDANLDPAAELGDGVTADGIYGVISRINDDGYGYPQVTAPGQAELEEEYPMGDGPMMQQLQKKFAYQEKQLASTRSEISKNSEQIQLMVSEINGQNDKFAAIDTRINSIKLVVSSSGNSASIALEKDGVQMQAQNITITGFVTFDNLSTQGETTINGANITTGKITDTGSKNYWDLNEGKLVTDSMTANNINANGTFECGTTYKVKLTNGRIVGVNGGSEVTEISTISSTSDGDNVLFISSSNYIYLAAPHIAVGTTNSKNGRFKTGYGSGDNNGYGFNVFTGVRKTGNSLYFTVKRVALTFWNGICTSFNLQDMSDVSVSLSTS